MPKFSSLSHIIESSPNDKSRINQVKIPLKSDFSKAWKNNLKDAKKSRKSKIDEIELLRQAENTIVKLKAELKDYAPSSDQASEQRQSRGSGLRDTAKSGSVALLNVGREMESLRLSLERRQHSQRMAEIGL